MTKILAWLRGADFYVIAAILFFLGSLAMLAIDVLGTHSTDEHLQFRNAIAFANASGLLMALLSIRDQIQNQRRELRIRNYDPDRRR